MPRAPGPTCWICNRVRVASTDYANAGIDELEVQLQEETLCVKGPLFILPSLSVFTFKGPPGLLNS